MMMFGFMSLAWCVNIEKLCLLYLSSLILLTEQAQSQPKGCVNYDAESFPISGYACH